MIRAVQRKINREMTLVLSERTRGDTGLPTGTQKHNIYLKALINTELTITIFCVGSELWKKAPLKYSLSPERPQMVETFIQQLMEEAEGAEGQVH